MLPIKYRWSRVRRKIRRFSWGGAWAAALPRQSRQNLSLFFYDGLFAAASDRIILTYLTIYLLSLNVTPQQIGLLNAVSNFAAALVLLPAALMVERSGERKKITLASAAASRTAILLMAVFPFFLKDTGALIWVILALALLREVFNNFGYPGWIAITGDMVPLEGRGRYFGTRNFIMGIAAIISALVVGEAITRIGEPLGYQLAFILAVVLGVTSMTYFSRLRDRQPERSKTTVEHKKPRFQNIIGLKSILLSVKDHPMFINFLVFNAVWNFSLNVAGPFFDVFMVETLQFTAAMIGVQTVAHTIASLITQPRVGALADRWGNRNVAIIFMLVIPLLPLAWGLWISQYWQVILIQTIAGFFWGAFNLASFNNLLRQTPDMLRARFSAFHQIVVTLSLSVGAAIGSLLIGLIEFRGLTIISAVGRWLAAGFFIYYVKELNHAPVKD